MKGKCMLAMVLVVAGTWLAQSVSEPAGAGEKKKKKAPYVHSVIFYLKKDAPKDEAAELIKDAHTLLKKIPSVRSLRIGRPAEKATPKLAVTDYQVGLLVLFDDYDGLQTYLDHKLHLEYVDRHLKHVERALVYDFVNQKE